MNKLNNSIEKNIDKIIYIFMFIQPILDIIAGISINYFNINTTISSIIRLSFMLFCIYYLFFLNKTENKKNNIKITIIILIYITIFAITTIIYKDLNIIPYELKNTINTFYFPITLLAMIDIFKQYKIKFNINNLFIIYTTYILFIIIPNILGIGFNSYSHSKIGNIGWFLSANSIGNIISILLPIICIYIIKSKKIAMLKIISIISTLYAITTMGTKVPILSLLICITGTFIYYFIKWIKNKKYTNIIISSNLSIIIIMLSIIFIPKTSFYKNIETHKNYLGLNNYFQVFTKYELMDHFIFSQRLTFLKNTSENYQKANLIEKNFGIGYIENYKKTNENKKAIEIDYFEILYRHGIVGFIIYFSSIIPTIIKSLKTIKKKNIENTELKISIMLILLLSFFAGHVLTTPNVNIFISLLFAIILKGGFNEKTN